MEGIQLDGPTGAQDVIQGFLFLKRYTNALVLSSIHEGRLAYCLSKYTCKVNLAYVGLEAWLDEAFARGPSWLSGARGIFILFYMYRSFQRIR